MSFLIGSITSHMQTKFEKKSRNFIVAPYYLVLHNYNRSYTAEIKWYRTNSPYLTTKSMRCKLTISSPLSMISRWFTANTWQMNTIYEIGLSESMCDCSQDLVYTLKRSICFSHFLEKDKVLLSHAELRVGVRISTVLYTLDR